jgi:hypothetical protein
MLPGIHHLFARIEAQAPGEVEKNGNREGGKLMSQA